jgi:hypothetical protein
MMREDRLSPVLRLTQSQPEDIDAILCVADSRAGILGQDIAPCDGSVALPPLSLAEDEMVAVAVTVSSPLENPADVAARLCALSIEQEIEIVVLTSLDYSGLERFGFRTERIAGNTEAEHTACVEELKRFWGIELTIPA